MPLRRGAALGIPALISLAACAAPPKPAVVELTLPPIASPKVGAAGEDAGQPISVLAPLPRLYDVTPGMTLAEIRARLGTEDETRDLEQTLSWWRSANATPERELPYLLGLDHTLTFNQASPDHERPVWYVYMREGRAVQLKVTVYEEATRPELKKRFGFPPTCFLYESAKEIARTLGRATVIVPEPPKRTFHYYLERGIAVMEENERVEVFDIFEPMTEARAAEVARSLRRPAD